MSSGIWDHHQVLAYQQASSVPLVLVYPTQLINISQ